MGGTRSVLRRLRRYPLFTLVTVAILAVALGANAAIFSVGGPGSVDARYRAWRLRLACRE